MIEEDGKTLWCGNLAEQVTEELLYELFLQAGPLEKVRIPRDRDGRQKNFAFITFCHDVSVPYAINLFKGTSLFHRTLSLQCRNQTAALPPPIRCNAFDQTTEFPNIQQHTQQFAEMTENFRFNYQPPNRDDLQDRLSVASLQGHWNQRHHPYRKGERDQRHRGRGEGNVRNDDNPRGDYNHYGNEKHNYNPWEPRRDGRRDDRYINYGGNNNRRNNYRD